jgi:hypothetical protein
MLAFCAVLSLVVAWVVTEFPYALDGLDVAERGKVPNYFRNLLEVLNFSSGPALFIAAIFAFTIAVKQAREAENTKVSTVYMQIVSRWNSPELINGRRKLLELSRAYRAMGKEHMRVPPQPTAHLLVR